MTRCETCKGYGTTQAIDTARGKWERRVLVSIRTCSPCEGYGWVELGAGDA